MGKIYCIMGKSSSGKDRIYRELLARGQLSLKRIVPYTTRPARENETPGETYVFCDERQAGALEEAGRIVELRAYNTVYGVWKYFTVDDGRIDLSAESYLYIVTLAGYRKIREHFGNERTVPIYIEVDDGERLARALARERMQKEPMYEEMCRRFLADTEDFSQEKLAEAGIKTRFVNDNLEETIGRITEFIRLSESIGGQPCGYENQ